MAFLRWIVFSNVWVSLAAPSLLWLTATVLDVSPGPAWYVFVWAGTLFTYNIQRLFKATEYLGPEILGRHRWIWIHRPALHVLTFFSACITAACLFYIPFKLVYWLLPSAFVSALYFIPTYRSGGRRRRLRDVPLLKINLVALTWAWTLVAAPALVFQKPPGEWWALFVFEFFFCFGLTVPFDIRDSRHDRQEGTRTFVSEWGVRRVRRFAALSLLTGLPPLCFAGLPAGANPALVLLTCVAAVSAYMASETRDELYYGFWLDGLIVAQGPLVYAAVWLGWPF